jgi:hypothetical protein
MGAPGLGQGAGVEQMSLRRLIVRPTLLQVVQRRQRLGVAIPAELGLGLAQGECRFIPQRQFQGVIIVTLRLVETPDVLTFLRQRGAVGDRVGGGAMIRKFAIALLRIEPIGHATPRPLHVRTAGHFRDQFDHDIGVRTEPRDHQDDEGPGLQPPGPGCVIDQGNVEQQQDQRKRHVPRVKKRYLDNPVDAVEQPWVQMRDGDMTARTGVDACVPAEL